MSVTDISKSVVPAEHVPGPLEAEWKQIILPRVLSTLDLSMIGNVDERRVRAQIREIANRFINEESAPLSLMQRRHVVRQIEDEVMGLGPLEPLLADPSVSDILVNGAHHVYVERGGKIERTDIRFHDDAHLLNIIDRIVSRVGRRIDESVPMVDARLQDGSRVNAIIPPLALDGPVLSIRRFGKDALTTDDLIRLGSLSPALVELLKAVVLARLNVMISGGTGSGKTTLLNVMSGFIPERERIITIEDSAELQLRQPHVVRLETRQVNVEGRGQITQRDLVRNSLRMRPDRIVVGEVRGAEALDMLQAMNTGHDGSLTTVHANSSRDALSRIETMVAMSGVQFPIAALRAQIAAAIDVIIHVERHEDGRRRVTSLQEINGMEADTISMSEIFTFTRSGVDSAGNVLGRFRATGIVPEFYDRIRKRGIDLPVALFSDR
ncbi:MAG: CpaF family protein [Gammaproteobacteria bacterium]|jgi:pilus assembly protein CpaF|nr:CpaF family protein [Gammaproteobacteria bacterium]NBR17552.1 CpaF family protein [Gammaproteobacteria bacterium]NDB16682.1 CpaF family protein [Gammaproteobacteria bacterium]